MSYVRKRDEETAVVDPRGSGPDRLSLEELPDGVLCNDEYGGWYKIDDSDADADETTEWLMIAPVDPVVKLEAMR